MTDRTRWTEKHLHCRFTNQSLLEQALTHRSASKKNNERLEFLGDALLSFTIANELYKSQPDGSEGDLSRARAALVNKTSLASIGRRVEIDSQIILGQGELRSGGAQRSSALADTVEALIGAVFLDQGYAAAEQLIILLFGESLETLPDSAALKDPKTKLQEWLQGRGYPLPKYSVQSILGSDHNKTFEIVCAVEGQEACSTGRGSSRRGAEQDAAAAMLTVLTGERQ